jgi:RNA polymerase sigma-70 factor (ECF subfamily)
VSDVEDTVLDQLGADAIQRAIDQLPPQFRATVQMADVEGLSYADIAEATGVAKGTVMSRLFRGRRLLQRALWSRRRRRGSPQAARSISSHTTTALWRRPKGKQRQARGDQL